MGRSGNTHARIERILRSKMYKCGDEFSAAHMYTQLAGESRDAVKYALEYMVGDGTLNKRIDDSKATHYSRPPRSLLSVNWRVDESVYQLLEESNGQ